MVDTVRSGRLRSLLPEGGRGYELFDGSFLLAAVGLFGYVLADVAPQPSRAGLEPLQFITQAQLGWVLVVAALIGVVASYGGRRLLTVGYTATTTATLALSVNFVWAWGRTLDWAGLAEPGIGSWTLHAGLITDDTNWVPLASAFLYGWVARKLVRDNLREAS